LACFGGGNLATSDQIRLLRRELGRELAERRKTAGYTQAELGRRVGYSRSTISTVESGGQQVPRAFWESCDALLGAGLAERFDRVHLPVPGVPAVPDSLAAYGRLGWPVSAGPDGLQLVTGSVVDALELSRPAGLLAVTWWLDASTAPVQLLPPPKALAVIVSGARFFFLVAAGACPWTGGEHYPAPPADAAAVIRWHAEGGRIPVPPGPGISWLYPPSAGFRPPSPVTLLGLLARATAAVRQQPGALALHDGILAVPAWRK
jgi:DNA-binding XRE family transcriptional regulator